VKALEASGIIAGYRAEVSRARAGLGLTVFIGLKVIRTILSRGPLPLDHWRGQPGR